MDPFTQRLLERTRERREMLTKKMDTSPRRKRSQPLAENQAENVSTATSESDDSPNKRQCLREAEQSIKSDTPAIKGVRSRLQHLVDQRDEWGSESGSTDDTKEDDHHPAASRQDTKRTRTEDVDEGLDERPAPRSRRSRFAALAQNINNWEDDLHQPQLKKNEKPKKVWQRPAPMETNESNNPSKPPRTFEYASETPRVVSNKGSPAKPPRFVSPAKSATVKPTVEKHVVSTLKVTLGSPAEAVSVSKTISRSPSPRKPSPVKTPVAQKRTTNLDVPSPARKSPRTSDENEPTKKPVSARLAQWQQRTEDADAEKDKDAEPTATPVSSRLAGWQQKVNQEESNAGTGAIKSTPVRKASPVKPSWQARPTGHVASTSKQESRSSPVKSTSPAKTLSVAQKTQQFGQQQQQQKYSPVKAVSPSKVAPATKAIRDRLQAQLQKSWKDNEIAEKARQQKEADMAVLQNRWKNGVLKETSDTEEAPPAEKPVAVTPSIAPGTVPPPPPLPSANSTPKQTNKSPLKKTPAKTTTPQSARHGKMNPKREEQRDKLRNETATGDGESIENNFESKLSAMGFEVSAASNGKVATLDLTPQRERDYAARAAAASAKKTTTPASLKVTEKKVVTTTFRDAEKTTTTTKTNQKYPAPATPVTTKPVAPSGGGHSIYSIIKRQTGATPATATSTTPAAQSRSRTTPAQSSRRDSFDSDESSFESEAYDDSEPESEGYGISRQSSQTSTQSDQSQPSQYGDTQSTTDYTSQTDCTDTEGYTAEEVNNDTEEDSLDDEYGSGSEEDCSEISDLLDEAMDETTTETESDIPVPAPRRNRLTSQDYSRPSHQSGSRSPQKSHHQPAAVERRYHAPMQPDKRVTWAAGSQPTPCSSASESEPETERRLVYSLDLYRSTRGEKNGPTPHRTIVRHSEHYKPEESEEEMPYIPEKSVRQRLQELQEAINQEQSVIMQTSNALNQCCHSNSAFAGSAEAVECHRLLLLACKKREAYLTEMTHLRENRPQHRKGPQGSLTITDLRLPLKKDLQSRLSNAQGGMQVHYFLVMVRHENHVIFTQMQSTNDVVRGCLDFPNLIKYNDIRQNFKVDLEVYGMYITKEPLGQTPKKKKGLTPKKPKSKSSGLSMQSPGGPLAVRSTNFVCVAHMTITQQSLNKTHFNLDGVPYSSPMQGTIHLNLRCIMENNVEERGFLTMFEDVSGFGAWHRRWCALKNNRLSYWKYPEEEKLKEPMGYIDFKQCITDTVGVIPRDICARPNTFELVTVRRQTRGEQDTLVSRCYNTMTTTKHWISADIKEDRVVWCNKLNEALRNLRAWNADALRPIKRQ